MMEEARGYVLWWMAMMLTVHSVCAWHDAQEFRSRGYSDTGLYAALGVRTMLTAKPGNGTRTGVESLHGCGRDPGCFGGVELLCKSAPAGYADEADSSLVLSRSD